MAKCGICGTSLPETFIGYTCNACKMIEAINKQNQNLNTPHEEWSSPKGPIIGPPLVIFVILVVWIDFVWDHWLIKLLWFATKAVLSLMWFFITFILTGGAY